MSTERWFKESLEQIKDTFEYRLETLIMNITEDISKAMKVKKINRTQLAEILNVSPAAITKILNGNPNFTLKTLLTLADALGTDLRIEIKEKTVSKDVIAFTSADAASFCEPVYTVGVPTTAIVYSFIPNSGSGIIARTTEAEFIGDKTQSIIDDACVPDPHVIYSSRKVYQEW